ncbi:unnamed protein product [Timema podura]|uniref:SLC41A/MgtE integral membrane domain-containing protein n=1 Tax=Timema podura TaxID=61482 RepID=A0ABN7NS52_TIMPD|nr:unnamed protein product [Timema podura]
MSNYTGLAAFQPVINGVGGNLVSVQASRLSTALHQSSELGTLPPDARICISPVDVYCSNQPYAVTTRVLMVMVIPGHLTFVYAISYIQRGDASLTPLFVCFYLLAAFVQVAILLYVAYVLTYFFWLQKVDPDNSTIPYLTALGDLLGICEKEYIGWVGGGGPVIDHCEWMGRDGLVSDHGRQAKRGGQAGRFVGGILGLRRWFGGCWGYLAAARRTVG